MGKHNSETIVLTLDERASARTNVELAVTVSVRGIGSFPARIVDASARGCRLLGDARLPVGAWACLEIPGCPPFKGWVAWEHDGTYGIDFQFAQPSTIAAALVARPMQHA